MSVLVSGATGFIGSALVRLLRQEGRTVRRLVRTAPKEAGDVTWDPNRRLDHHNLQGVEEVIHLAGESIASGRWNEAKKRRIEESRIQGTAALADSLASMPQPPRVMIAASAVGFYGDRGSELLSESAGAGSGFLPEVCVRWEKATAPALSRGIRVAQMRMGVVLGDGGALKQMLLPFRLGLGGTMGTGRQYMSWITMEDLCRAFLYALKTPGLSGPVNATAPTPVTNREFTKTLARVLRRPAIFPVPAFAARILLGEMSDALLMSSARVVPDKLLSAGFTFNHSTLEPALRSILK